MCFLPEGCDYIAETKMQSLEFAEPLDGPIVNRFKQLATDLKVWLSLGGIHIKVSNSYFLLNFLNMF